jgi:hypothetical protein
VPGQHRGESAFQCRHVQLAVDLECAGDDVGLGARTQRRQGEQPLLGVRQQIVRLDWRRHQGGQSGSAALGDLGRQQSRRGIQEDVAQPDRQPQRRAQLSGQRRGAEAVTAESEEVGVIRGVGAS